MSPIYKRLLAIFILLAVVLLLGINTKSIYHAIKDIRATSLADNAYQSYLSSPNSQETIKKAVEQAQAALHLFRHNYSANRTLATLTMFSQPKVSLQYWEQSRELWNKKKPIPIEDSINYIQTLLISDHLTAAYRLLLQLKSSNPSQIIHYNLAKICLLKGNQEEALKYARLIARDPETPIYQHLLYIGICLKSEQKEVHDEGEKHMQILCNNDELVDESVLWEMTQFKNISVELKQLLKAKLNERVTQFDDRISLAEYQVINKVKTPLEVYQELEHELDRFNNHAMIHLAQWCSKHGLTQQALDLLDPGLSLQRKDWFLLYVKNLGKNNEWGKIIHLLDDFDCPIESFWHHVIKAEAFFEQGKQAQAANAWYRAKLESTPTIEHYWLLIRIGDKYELSEATHPLLDSLIVFGVSVQEVLGYIAQREFRRNDYEAFYKELTFFKQSYLGNPDIINDWAYYSILMNRNIENAVPIINRMIEEFPDRLRYHMTWALYEIKKRQYGIVLERFKSFHLKWDELHVKWRFILALALAGVGEQDQAYQYFGLQDKQSLNPYELELFEKLFDQ